MSKTATYLKERRAEIEAEIAELRAELHDINSALAAIGVDPNSPDSSGRALPLPERKTRPGSIADWTFRILADNPQGLRSSIIRKRMKKLGGKDIDPKGMSWHLSHLKREGHLVLEGELWKLAPRDNEADDASPSPASNESQDRPSLLD